MNTLKVVTTGKDLFESFYWKASVWNYVYQIHLCFYERTDQEFPSLCAPYAYDFLFTGNDAYSNICEGTETHFNWKLKK